MKNLKETIKEFGKTYINGGNGIAFDYYMTLNVEDAGLLDIIYDIVDELTLNDEWEEIEINNDDIEISTERQAEKITSEQQEQQEKGDKIENIKNIYDVKEFIKAEVRELEDLYFFKDSDGDYIINEEGEAEIIELLSDHVSKYELLKIFVRSADADMREIQSAVYEAMLENGMHEDIEELIYYEDIIDTAEELLEDEIEDLIFFEVYECMLSLFNEIQNGK